MFRGVGVDWTVGLTGRKREGELHVFYKSGCGGWWSGQIFTTIKQRKQNKTKKNLVISLQIPKIVLKHFKNSQIRVRL